MKKGDHMKISKANYEIIKAAAISGGVNAEAVREAIRITEEAEKKHNEKMVKYIIEKRKANKNYCR